MNNFGTDFHQQERVLFRSSYRRPNLRLGRLELHGCVYIRAFSLLLCALPCVVVRDETTGGGVQSKGKAGAKPAADGLQLKRRLKVPVGQRCGGSEDTQLAWMYQGASVSR